MRVVLVTNGLGYGGAERVVEALADDLRAAGDAVRVVATTRGGPIADELRGRGHLVDVLGIRAPFDLRVALALAAIARQHRADVLHSHLAVSDIASAFAPAGPLWRLSTVHNPGVELGRMKRRLWAVGLRRIDDVVAVSEAARAGVPGGSSVGVVHPSLIDLSSPVPSRDEARRRLGLPLGERVVLAIGRLARVKGLDVLAAALPHVRGATVAVIGEGPERARLEGQGLRLLGPHPEAGALAAAADVVALPSRSEGFPQVPLHAMAASVPVVATRVGGTPEVVIDGVTGLLVPPEDPTALAAALRRLLDEPLLAQRLGAAGRARLEQAGLTRAAMTDAYRARYRSGVLGQNSPSPRKPGRRVGGS